MLHQLKNTIKSWISINEYNIVHDLYDKGYKKGYDDALQDILLEIDNYDKNYVAGYFIPKKIRHE